MKQTEIIAHLRDLRESQAEFAKTNGDEIYKRDVEALDAAIKALERIRWRKVGEERPECATYWVDILRAIVATDDPDIGFVSQGEYCPTKKDPWYCPAQRMRVTHWAYLPELPEEEDKNG